MHDTKYKRHLKLSVSGKGCHVNGAIENDMTKSRQKLLMLERIEDRAVRRWKTPLKQPGSEGPRSASMSAVSLCAG